MRSRHRQGGWIGLIVILLALVIVAVLSQTLLKRMGLVPDDHASAKAGARAPGAVGAAPIDATGAPPTPTNAIERAKGLESSLQQQSQDMSERIDAQTK
jgi:hypothetical protein